MDLVCRLCCCTYNNIAEVKMLFDDKNKKLLSKLNYFSACFTFRIDANDGFPPYICLHCANLLQAAYQFKTMCESAEANFKALSQPNVTDEMKKHMDVKYQIEFIGYERDCKSEDVEMDDNTSKATPNDDTRFTDESDGENANELDHWNVIEKSGPVDPSSHSETHKRSKKRIVSTCEICGATFSNKRGLQGHTRDVHNSTLYICESCGRKFQSQHSLTYHINGAHVDIVKMNYSCDLCDFKCRQARYLQDHMVKHTGARPHVCDECGLTFGALGSRNRHVQAVHRNAKPHKCTICDRHFKSTAQLKEHSNYHADRPLECPHCPRTYRYKNGLRRHVKQCHRSNNSK